MSRKNLTWQHFDVLYEDKRTAFEYLCRALFRREQCDIGTILHSDPNQAGIEVRPVYSKKCGKRISFQAKYFDSRVDYSQIKHSAEKTVEYFKDQIW